MSRQRLLLFVLVCLCTTLSLSACGPRRSKPMHNDPTTLATPIPRPDPGYIQQLERISLLSKAVEMAKVVSGSELAWRAPGTHDGPEALLGHADIWLSINPLSFLSSARRTALDQLSDPTLWPILREAGIKGVYVAPMFGSGSLWSGKVNEDAAAGDDTVQLSFAPSVGKDAHYRRFMGGIIDNQGLLGSDLLPAATGIGPDYFLAARNYHDYSGIYCMMEVPPPLWKHLPAASSEWQGVPLSAEQIAALSAEHILPPAMVGELSEFSGKSGWAATGEVNGMDGNTRRWIYRYYKDPSYAVLNWEDPSRTANRILSGSAVYQVGLLGQAFIGLRFDAFQGLEAAPSNLAKSAPDATASSYAQLPLEPALPAAQALSREIRRYGGWSWLRNDTLPLPALREFLRAGTDFAFDSAFSPAAEHALLTGDATLLRFMTDEVLRLEIDTRRLVHATPSEDGLNYTLPHLEYLAGGAGGAEATALRTATGAAMRTALAKQTPLPVKDDFLYTTSAGLAAMALELPVDIDDPSSNAAPAGSADATPIHVQVLASRSSNATEQIVQLSGTTGMGQNGTAPVVASGSPTTNSTPPVTTSADDAAQTTAPSAAIPLTPRTDATEAILTAREAQSKLVQSKEDTIAKGHALLIFFKAMQPGVLMLTGQDLVGAMPLRWNSMTDGTSNWDVRNASRGGYALTRSAASLIVSQQGMPKTETLYPAADQQVHDKKSFLRDIGEFLRMRSAQGVGKGTLVARPQTRGKGAIALLSKLEDGRYLLAVSNFSRNGVTESISLAGYPLSHITAYGTNGSGYRVEGSTLILELGSWSGKAIFLGPKK